MTKALAIFIFLFFTLSAQAEMVVIDALPNESTAAEATYQRVRQLFERLGLLEELQFRLIFSDQVVVNGDVPVYGYFDSDVQEIHMQHFSAKGELAQPWGLDWDDETAVSFLTHEMAHAAIIAYMKERAPKLSGLWHETLAYAIQFELMPPSLRARVAAQYPKASAFDGPPNAEIFDFDPNFYSYRVSLSLPAWGGEGFLKDMMDLKSRF